MSRTLAVDKQTHETKNATTGSLVRYRNYVFAEVNIARSLLPMLLVTMLRTSPCRVLGNTMGPVTPSCGLMFPLRQALSVNRTQHAIQNPPDSCRNYPVAAYIPVGRVKNGKGSSSAGPNIHNSRARPSDVPVGARVFTRNRGIKGRNKIQEAYDDKPYKVVDRLQDHVYVVEPLQTEGPTKTVHRNELLLMREIAQAIQSDEECMPQQDDTSNREQQGDDPDSFDEFDVCLPSARTTEDTQVNHREPALHKAGEPLNADKGESTMHGESVALHHSARTSAGVHTNPYHVPTTVVQHGVEMTCTPVLVTPEHSGISRINNLKVTFEDISRDNALPPISPAKSKTEECY
ncbi:hypothetical protein LSAT2_027162 [Lamellibrachia satsuma]|nr:hypothetical protein LSAT2_027162 [Lamellibrachia satsuma]